MALFGAKKTKDEAAATPIVKKEVKKEVKKDVKKDAGASMQDLYSQTDNKKSGAKKTVSKFDRADRILVKPLVTEKAANLSTHNKYVFIVDNKANKIEIAKAIKAVYGVKPLDVNVANFSGKQVSRGRIRGKRKDWKKAVITLAKGDSIKVYEGV